MESYQTLRGAAEGRYEEKKSQFIARAAFADSEQAALDVLARMRQDHRTANHHVYAYLLRDGARTRYSDDGEPAKTSGLPTLEVIRHAGLSDCIIVTARYFGGTLLGTGGLVRAYTAAALAALENAQRVTVVRCVRGSFAVDYALYEQTMRLLDQYGAQCGAPVFAQRVSLTFVLPAGGEGALLTALDQLCRGQAGVKLSDPFYAPF